MYMYQLLKLNENFRIEMELMNTKYPFSKNRSKIILEELRKRVKDLDDRIDRFEIVRQNLDNLVNICLANISEQIITMKYCQDQQEKENYAVYLQNNKLCYFRNDKYIPIDSTEIFKEFFDGRVPAEDEKYLESIGFPMLPERSGKSEFSCFVIDKDNKMYINPYRPDTIQHTFTTYGDSVLCAGLILLKNGTIYYIDNTSGHYLTGNEKLELFFIFLKQNSKIKNISVYFDKEFLKCRNDFSWPLKGIIEKKEYGLKFCHIFREKTFCEIEEEKRLRKYIFEKYELKL